MRRILKMVLISLAAIVLVPVPIIIGLIGLDAWDKHSMKMHPDRCPLAHFLPDPSAATRCLYSGFMDFSIDFGAHVSRADFDAFVASLAATFPEASREMTETSRGIVWDIRSPNTAVFVSVSWKSGQMYVTYDKY